MAKKCALCGKKPTSGNNVSHSNLKTRREWRPNLQKITASISGGTKKLLVCTRCLKTLKKKGNFF
jgi:large subunit ribosomal protein L28